MLHKVNKWKTSLNQNDPALWLKSSVCSIPIGWFPVTGSEFFFFSWHKFTIYNHRYKQQGTLHWWNVCESEPAQTYLIPTDHCSLFNSLPQSNQSFTSWATYSDPFNIDHERQALLVPLSNAWVPTQANSLINWCM